MSTKKGIGYSPLTEKVYIGRQNAEKGMWIGEKEDITNQFIDVSFEYFTVNTVRKIGCSDGSSNLFINVKNDIEGIEKVICKLKHLQKLLVGDLLV